MPLPTSPDSALGIPTEKSQPSWPASEGGSEWDTTALRPADVATPRVAVWSCCLVQQRRPVVGTEAHRPKAENVFSHLCRGTASIWSHYVALAVLEFSM